MDETSAAIIFAAVGQSYSFTDGMSEVDITDISLAHDDTALSCTIAAVADGVPVAMDNPVIFVNPPLYVRDGNFTEITDDSGNIVQLPTYRIDPAAAFTEIVSAAVSWARQAG